MEELTIKEIHKATIDNLKKIIEICDKIHVNYFLAYGSLIGAIRHKGFIPWDDDCDLVMLRPDYEKFMSYCIQHEKELYPYKLLCRENTKNYPYNIARFNDMRYKAIYDNVQQYESGLFVDIYPLDGIDNLDKESIEALDKKRDYLIKMILWAIDDHYEPSTHNKWYRSVIKYFIRLYAKLRGAGYFLDKMENMKNLYSFEKSEYVAEMTWDVQTVIYEKRWFSDYITVKFENIDVKIPKEYDAFLKVHYGDYMQLPKIEDRVPSHGYKLYLRE